MKRLALALLVLLLTVQCPNAYNLARFVYADNTDQLERANCMQYSAELTGRLQSAGWDAGMAEVEFSNRTGHAFVWVKTLNGTLYIEPQNDNFYVIRGDQLCDQYECKSFLYYEGE